VGEAARRVAVVTPWFPTPDLPYRGAFVRAMVDATAPGCDAMTVYHCDSWVATFTSPTLDAVQAAHRELLRTPVPRRATVGGAGLRYLPVPVPRGLTHAAIARYHADALRAALSGEPIEEPVVHAHVGLPSGWAALQNAGQDSRVFVTEHASFLRGQLDQPDAREMYDELLHRCAGFFSVGDGVRTPLLEAFPHHADKIGAIANPIAFDRPRPEPVTALRRWLFVGALTPLKGVDVLLEAFAKCRADDTSLKLTLVGDGPLGTDLRARAAALGIADAVRFTGSIPPDEALAEMRGHDLLVHPSRAETFGVAVVEALAAGIPVLVTRCGGPQRTLAGIEAASGEMIDVDDDPGSIADGYRRLRSRFPSGLDLHLARHTLDQRYGYPAVARIHYAAWFPDTPAEPRPTPVAGPEPAPDGRVLFLALGGSRRKVVVAEASAVLAAGGRATVVVDVPGAWNADPLPAGAKVVEAGRLEGRHWPLRLADRVLIGAPRRVVRLLSRGRLQPIAQRAGRAYERRLADRVRRRVVLPTYRRMWTDARTRLLAREVLRGGPYDRWIVTDPVSMPDAVRLAGTAPAAPPIGFALAGKD
jgi:glycogen synthase